MSTFVTALCVAGAMAVAGHSPRGRVGRDVTRAPKTPRDGPSPSPGRSATDIRLFAACCRAGLPVAAAAGAVADTHGEDPSPWHTVAALSALGADPARAWAELHTVPGGEELAHLVALSNATGATLAAGCERIAVSLTADAADHATARAERAGVLIALPLTAFFLPAFFVLGLAPVVVSLGQTLF
ncbi:MULTISPECIES: type II secretion system F family protein [Corynebacterium]|uniref:type II secretion system F family protein n=1 Tax=Corynebacterium TaxID=1716 RepID=UPI0008FB4424|nr:MULTISPECIES: type II secretion system F family protein [Corynebacterium]OIR40909.1 hypothetical protein BJP08_10610 [Corynebacterium sp. NML140438]WPJ92066.1 type II secretion system F family protein [Corynebacterium sp. UMB2355A]